MLSKLLIIFNRSSGAKGRVDNYAQTLIALFEKDFASVKLLEVQDQHFKAQLQKALAQKPQIVVAAGGDGTVSFVANLIANTNMTLGVLPMGTLNHFARDLNLPDSLEACAKLIAGGKGMAVDIAAVNDRYFINNSSVGLYPALVIDRDEQIKKVHRNKWLAMAIAAFKLWFRYPVLRLEIHAEGQVTPIQTPLVFIGNNHYDLERRFSRKALNRGHLCVYILNCSSRFALMRLLMQALRKGFYAAEDLTSHQVESLVIRSDKPKLKIARDGEVIHCTPPLRYRVHKKALNVIAGDA